MTFSVAEINDLKARASTIAAFGDFSTIEFTLLGLGDPRLLHAGVVGGSYFEVMALRPVLGRLLNASDDGPRAAGAVVLTHRFWTSSFNSDPTVIGKPIRLGPGTATIVGVLEPSIPYPVDTDIFANMVTSPHHLGATMNIERTHRMTELFGRLALIALQAAHTGYDTRHVLAVDVPRGPGSAGYRSGEQGIDFDQVTHRIGQLPGVDGVAVGSFVPWRDTGIWPRFQFAVEGYTPANGEENPHARQRFVGPGFFALLGIPLLAGRDFTAEDRRDRERVVIVSQTIAQRLFPNGDAHNRKLWSTDLRDKPVPRRIVGVVADVDDENVVRAPAMTVYFPFRRPAGRPPAPLAPRALRSE